MSTPTRRLYRDDPYQLEFDARVLERRLLQGRPAVILDQTAFYAESGGQPWDTGQLNDVNVIAVVEEGGVVVHMLEGALPDDSVHGLVDGARRRDFRQQHHGQHLLSRAFVDLLAAPTVSVHLGTEGCSIDVTRDVTPEQVAQAVARANEVVWEARPVRVKTVSRAEALAAGVKTPDEAGDAVRLVEAEGFDLQACGGTHPRSTAEVGVVVGLGQERYKGGTRVRFLCGHRALAAFFDQARVLGRLSALLSTPGAALPDAVIRLQAQLTDARRRADELAEKALGADARELYAAAAGSGTPAVVVRVFESESADNLRTLANHLLACGPCVALLGSRAEKAHLLFAQSEGLGHDIPTLLRQAAATIGGRGGGKGNMAQGGGDDVAKLDQALAAAAATVRAALAP